MSSDIRATLTSERVVRYEISEVFTNRGAGIGEADYVLPLPRNAAFRELRLFINGEPIAGEVLSADRARGIYEEIVRRQQDPALVEWMGQGLLRARIFPIAPGERKRVLVRYDAVVEREGDALRVDYFRGSRGTAGRPDPRVRPAARAGDQQWRERTSFSLAYPRALAPAWSPTHRVEHRDSAGVRLARVTGEHGHITILVPVRRPASLSVAAMTHAAGTDRHVLLAITPPPPGGARIPRDVTLVIDVSGSMSGAKIRQARAAATQVLRGLDLADRFRVVEFASDVRTFRADFATATRVNVAAAERYVQNLAASGGTNIEGALMEALETPSPAGRLPLVLFITDGMPTVGETRADVLAELVAQRRAGRRIFTFGVGADVNVALLERLALDGRGTAHFVRSEESIEHAVSLVASRLSEPVLTDVRVSVDGGVRIRDVYPRLPMDIFAGQDLLLLSRYEGAGRANVRISGRASGRDVMVDTEVHFPASDRRNDFVPRLWAMRRIGHLVAERRQSSDTRELDDEIRTLGMRYGLPSEFSSYLVLEPGVVQPQVADFSGRGAAGAAAGGTPPPAAVARGVRRNSGDTPVSNIVVTGAVTGTQAFESARAAAAQRDASTLASTSREAGIRVASDRTFQFIDSSWVQVSPASAMPGGAVIGIKPYSRAYFDIMDLVPELRAVFALGERVRVYGRRVMVELTPAGAEQLTGELRRALSNGW